MTKNVKNKKNLKYDHKGKRPKEAAKKAPVPNVPAEWLYLNPEKITTRQIYELFLESRTCQAEYWEEAGVLELSVPEADSVDLEEMECSLGDEEGDTFLAQHQIQTVYAVTIRPEYFDKVKPVMAGITEKLGGFFCGDTEDFLPRV